jgi:hypothetical protein
VNLLLEKKKKRDSLRLSLAMVVVVVVSWLTGAVRLCIPNGADNPREFALYR